MFRDYPNQKNEISYVKVNFKAINVTPGEKPKVKQSVANLFKLVFLCLKDFIKNTCRIIEVFGLFVLQKKIRKIIIKGVITCINGKGQFLHIVRYCVDFSGLKT